MTKIKKHVNATSPTQPTPSLPGKTVRVFFSDKQKGHDQFFVYAHEDMVHKWKSDKSIPLIEVVESFDIFDVANKGATGKAIRPTHAALSNTFGTSDVDLIIPKILETGKILHITAKGRNDMSKDLI